MIKNDSLIKVFITTPSINSDQNIGGISSFTKHLLEYNHSIEYRLFVRGKNDSEKRGFFWLIRQPITLCNFIKSLTEEQFKIVHINMPMEKISIIRDTFFVLSAWCLRKKIILHFQGGYYSINMKIPLILKILIKLSILLSDKIISLGNREKDFLIEYYKVRFNKIEILYNAVKLPKFSKIKLNGSIPVILYLGRIDKNKGLKEIIFAIELLKGDAIFKLIIAGDGPDKDKFLTQCQEKIPYNYEYLGIVSGMKKELVLKKSNIFLMPSYYEGLPYSLLEAMAHKIVPIVTPVGSIPEIIKDGKNGFLVPLYNYNSIYNRTIELITNPRKMEEMGQNAYDTIKQNYSIDGFIKKIHMIYSSVYT